MNDTMGEMATFKMKVKFAKNDDSLYEIKIELPQVDIVVSTKNVEIRKALIVVGELLVEALGEKGYETTMPNIMEAILAAMEESMRPNVTLN